MALASSMAGAAFSNAGLTLVHGITHAIGAICRVPHGVANALMLPYVMEFNAFAVPERFRDIAIALGENVEGLSIRDASLKSVEAVRRMAADAGVPQTLKEVGVVEKDVPLIVKGAIAHRMIHLNPRTVTEKDIERIVRRALGTEKSFTQSVG
jgi:alcohol dehydrogenase